MRTIVNAFSKVMDFPLRLMSLEGILLIPAIHLQLLSYNNFIISQILSMFNLCMIIVCLFRYRLWKYRACWLVGIILAWAYGTAIYKGADILKVFGCVSMRAWYLAIALFIVALVLDEKKRMKWLYCVCATGVVSATSFLGIFVVKATRELLYVSYVSDEKWGVIKSGRLHAMGNANTVGCEAVAAVLMATWLVYVSAVKQKRAKQKGRSKIATAWFYSGVVWFLAGAFDLVALGLSGSRGAILATAFGVSVMACGVVFRCKGGAWKRIVLSASTFLLVCVATIAISYASKQVYDVSIEYFVDNCDDSSLRNRTEVMGRLKPLGVTYEVGTLTDRTLIWKAVFQMMNENPEMWLTGITAPEVAYTFVQDVYEGRPDKPAVHAHNGYIQTLWTFGIPGALILVIILIDWGVEGIKAFFISKTAGPERFMVIFAVAALAEGMVEIFPFPFTVDWTLTFMFFIAVGTCIGINEGENNEQTKEQII